MYNSLKKLSKKLIPKRILFKYEPAFRYLVYLFHKGNKYQCNLCGKELKQFINLPEGDLLCPYCGSLARTRQLWQLLSSDYLKKGISILDFSPSRSQFRALKKNQTINYISSDLSGNFLGDKQYDITAIQTENELFDIIICYHILEHVEKDQTAMLELHRVLKKAGTCFIQTPFKDGDIYEDYSIIDGTERTKHFGQEDHVRIYSVEGLKFRLQKAGFKVEVKQFNETKDNKNGYRENETILLCTK